MIRLDVPIATPEVLDAIAQMYTTAANAMRDAERPTLCGAADLQGERKDIAVVEPVAVTPEPSEPEAEMDTSVVEISTDTVSDSDTDASGVEWDKVIHTRTRSKDAAGNWKRKGGVSDAVVYERLALQGIGVPRTDAVEGVQDAARKAFAASDPTTHDVLGEPLTDTVEATPAPVAGMESVADFVRWIGENKINTSDVMTALKDLDVVNGIAGLDGKPELIAKVCEVLRG